MKKVFGLIALLSATTAWAGHGVHWGYGGSEGPEYWGKLAQEYSTCSTGKNQSPVNLTQALEAKLVPLTFNYQTSGQEIENNGAPLITRNFAQFSQKPHFLTKKPCLFVIDL